VFWWIVVISVVGFTLAQLKQRERKTTIHLPHIHLCPQSGFTWVRSLSKAFFIGSIFFLCWAVIHWSVGSGLFERLFISEKSKVYPSPTSSRALFFVIDRSGSMAEPMPGSKQITKMDQIHHSVQTFVEKEVGDDLFGLVSFARAAMVRVPLSRDRSFFMQRLSTLYPETEEFRNGTALGYAIFKSVYLIEACRQFAQTQKETHFTGQALIVITDGLEEPHPADRNHPFRSMRYEQALRFAKEKGVRVYYLNIDKNSYERMSYSDRENLRKLVEATGGIYGEVPSSQKIEEVLGHIAQKEVYQRTEKVKSSSSLGYWLIVWALIFCSLSRLFETLVLRVVQ